MIRGAFYLRKAWKAYEGCLLKEEKSYSNNELCSCLNFGAGFFLFGCSLLPPSVGYLLSAIGFVQDRERGLECLRRSAECSGYMSPFAHIFLLWIERFFSNNMDAANRLLLEGLSAHPGSPIYLFLGSYVARGQGNVDTSIEYLLEARANAHETKQFALACLYELGASEFLRLNWGGCVALLCAIP